MSKQDTHATSPRYVRVRRNGAAVIRRQEKADFRLTRRGRIKLDSFLPRHCPHCGHGLSARYRVAGEVHLRRNTRPRVVCAWTP